MFKSAIALAAAAPLMAAPALAGPYVNVEALLGRAMIIPGRLQTSIWVMKAK